MDAVPGRLTTMWFTATPVGSYHIYCDQFCGTRHAAMIGAVIVMEPQDDEAWRPGARRGEAGPSARHLCRDRGFRSRLWNGGAGRGPSVLHVGRGAAKLTGGGAVVRDYSGLRESILDWLPRVL